MVSLRRPNRNVLRCAHQFLFCRSLIIASRCLQKTDLFQVSYADPRANITATAADVCVVHGEIQGFCRTPIRLIWLFWRRDWKVNSSWPLVQKGPQAEKVNANVPPQFPQREEKHLTLAAPEASGTMGGFYPAAPRRERVRMCWRRRVRDHVRSNCNFKKCHSGQKTYGDETREME